MIRRLLASLSGRHLGIMQRTALLAWLVAIITLLLFVVSIVPWQKDVFIENLRSKAYGVTVSLSEVTAGAVVNEDYSSVVDHCMEMLRRDPAIDYIVVTRNDGFALVHERSGWRSETLSADWHPAHRAGSGRIQTVPLFDRRIYAYAHPFDYSGIEWGWIHVGLSLESYDRSTSTLYRRTLILAVACIAFGLLASVAYAKLLVRPIFALQAVVQRVARGDLTARAPIDRRDELGHLADAFNIMAEAIRHRDRFLQEANETLEQRVRDRTRELEDQVAARERANQDLADAQRRLMQLSREAGMAEVATGVLHNVGNVLNSVNVSANVLRDRLATSPNYALLQQTTGLLRSHEHDLAHFLTEDPKGRLVLPLLLEIAHEFERQRADFAHEFTHLGSNIDHIKQIVAAQQSYARSGGLHQTFDPADLFVDTQRIVQASTNRHGITVTSQVPPQRPLLTTDRHLALQVLVNLLTNAIQAVKPRPLSDRRVDLHFLVEPDCVRFVVSDNGIGISPENLKNIFQHGFTTRKDGHGFGLHSGALAARELGGTLVVESAGLDRGARFTLSLPLTVPGDSGPLRS